MARKGKGGKKKQPKDVKDTLPEVDKEYYEIQIADLNKKLTRFKSKCAELERKNNEVKADMLQLDVDRADIIAYLKRVLKNKEDELNELKERNRGLTQAKETEKKIFLKEIDDMKHEFKVMNDTHLSEIKLINGKLNALEEFRLQRNDLMQKFKIQEEQMAEQKKDHSKSLYENEKNYIIAKDQLRQEMEEKLLKLSYDIQKATQSIFATTTKCVIRENVTINTQLSKLRVDWKNLFDSNKRLRQKNKIMGTAIDIIKRESHDVSSMNVIQSQVIDRLAYEHNKLFQEYSEWSIYETQIKKLTSQTSTLEKERSELKKTVQELKSEIHCAKVEVQGQLIARQKADNLTYILKKKFREASETIKQIFMLQQEKQSCGYQNPEEKINKEIMINELLKGLLMLIDKDEIVNTIESVELASAITILEGSPLKMKLSDETLDAAGKV